MSVKSLEARYFKILRQISHDLWNIRMKKEMISVEALELLVVHLSKLARYFSSIQVEYSSRTKSLLFEICSEISILIRDFSYAPFFTRLIEAFLSIDNFSLNQIAIFLLTFFNFELHSRNSIDGLNKALSLEFPIKLPKDKEKRANLLYTCYGKIKKELGLENNSFSSKDIINLILKKNNPKFTVNSPKELLNQWNNKAS
jgi:hypothetical protein